VALVWMHNTAGVEIRNCHLRNSGRSGVLMIGYNVGNQVSGCWIEYMGLKGVSLCQPRPPTPGDRTQEPGHPETQGDRGRGWFGQVKSRDPEGIAQTRLRTARARNRRQVECGKQPW
jgi:hypothetical protein